MNRKAPRKFESNLTPDQEKMLKQLFNTVWDHIAADVIEMTGGSCTRAEVIETVLDAGRPDTELEENSRFKAVYEESKAALVVFRQMTCKAQEAWMAAKVFTAKTYGW